MRKTWWIFFIAVLSIGVFAIAFDAIEKRLEKQNSCLIITSTSPLPEFIYSSPVFKEPRVFKEMW